MIPTILASNSPRRQELIKLILSKFLLREPKYQEIFKTMDNPEEIVLHNAVGKNLSISEKDLPNTYCLISADTIVVLGNKILGKPSTVFEAEQFLLDLSGNQHKVITGVSIRIRAKENRLHYYFSETSIVQFHTISKEAIFQYVKTAKPLDKAGAYGIQEIPGDWVKSIQGDIDNVVGLPIKRLKKELDWLNSFFN